MKRLLLPTILALACGVVASAHAATVLDQIYAPSTYPRANGNPALAGKSGDFTEAQYRYFSTAVVDDFSVDAATLDLTSVSALLVPQGGTFTTFAAIPNWEVAVYSTLALNYNNNGDSNALLTLPVNILLPAAGTYYLAVLSNNPLDTTGWVDVYTVGTNGGGNAYLESPYATGGPTSSASAGDAAYRIIGQPAAVPEPATWAAATLGAALLVLVRRRVKS